jgi:hypothetical protein
MVTEVGDDQFVVFPPHDGTLPPLKPPTGLFGIYEVTGELGAIRKNLPPKGTATRDAILEWIKQLKQNGCYIRPGNYAVKQTEIVDPS